MQTFYGTKLIAAQPMNRADYNLFRGWDLPKDENGADDGYLVEYRDGGKPNVGGYAGYVSWSPKEQFEASYQFTSAMSFGHAIQAMKAGYRVCRQAWNGKGMWVCLGAGSAQLPADKFWNVHTRQFAVDNGGYADVLPYFIMKTADDKIQMGWVASQTDMDANDWMIVGEV